jgi:ribosomal protein L11 methyltransferase
MAEWIEIRIPIALDDDEPWDPDDIAGLVAAELEAAKAGTWLVDDCIVYWVPAERGVDELARARAAAAELAARDVPLAADRVVALATAPEETWRDAWKRHFKSTRLTRQLVVVPSWDTFEPGADDLVIHLDPETAFGTGAHASTQLVLELMQTLRDGGEPAPARILDVGAGSGILAIAAALLWPQAKVVAIDNDVDTLAVAVANCAKNNVRDRVACDSTPVGELDGGFDLVVANIQADVLLALRDDLAARVRPGGHLLLSGLLAHQTDAVAAAYEQTRRLATETFRLSDRDPEWKAAHLRGFADLP